MPEGDTVAWHADRLRAVLLDRPLARVDGVAAVRRWAAALVGRNVDAVDAHGKHLLVEVGDVAVHVHLGMTGRWRLVGPQARLGPGDRLLLGTSAAAAICRGAPVVTAGPRREVAAAIDHLGPDLLDPATDVAAVTARAMDHPERPIVSVLLDQRIAAGIGNVIALESLFRAHVAPGTPIGRVPADRLEAAYGMARRMLRANADRPERVTTGDPAPGRRLWVYGRGGRPCRRCRTAIVEDRLGDPPRVAFWCPRCQALPAP